MREREQRYCKEDDKQIRTKEGRVNPPRLEGSGERMLAGLHAHWCPGEWTIVSHEIDSTGAGCNSESRGGGAIVFVLTRGTGTENQRLEAFTDGELALIIKIMVLESQMLTGSNFAR
jgi:hypothetical protein